MSDLISRQDAVNIINGYAEQFNGYIGTPNDSEVYAYARGLLLSIERNISALPSAQPERKKGKWILVNGHTSINCSVCHKCNWSLSFEDAVRQFNYCPNCGADMRGEKE